MDNSVVDLAPNMMQLNLSLEMLLYMCIQMHIINCSGISDQ